MTGKAKTFRELFGEVKTSVEEVQVDYLKTVVDAPEGKLILDVREPDEHEKGVVPGAVRLPRGFLELKIEEICPDRGREVVVYCAGGVRSVLAAKSLLDMGYTRVKSVAGGYKAWAAAKFQSDVPVRMSEEQRERYSRHLKVPEIGEAGQCKLLKARVLLVGAGGLGSPAGLYLGAAGVGTLGIVDGDAVDLSNLQRQVLHTTDRIGTPKVESAAKTIRAINPDVKVEAHAVRIHAGNVMDFVSRYDIVVDGCDNFETRYLVNDACVLAGKPNVYGSIQRFDGQCSIFVPRQGPCYRCLFPERPPEGLAPT